MRSRITIREGGPTGVNEGPTTLNAERTGMIEVNRRSCNSIGRRGFSGLSFLASDKSFELVSEQFPLSRPGP